MKASRAIFRTRGGLAASTRARACASASTVPGAARRLTSPSSSASAAPNERPVKSRSKARCRPMIRGRWAKWIAGSSPTSISGYPRSAPESATIMSQEIDNVMPPPRAVPLTAAIDGLPRRYCRSVKRVYRRSSSARTPSVSSLAKAFRSRPAQKRPGTALPRMIARTESSAAAVSKQASSSSSIGTLSALTGPLSIRISAMPSVML